MNLLEKKRLSRDLSGPATSVLFALILAGGTLTAVDLARDWCRESEPVVSDGLRRLAEHGLVTHYGKFEGWGVNLNQLALWQGHDGVFLSEKATSSISGSFVASPQKEPTAASCPPPVIENYEKTENLGFLHRSDLIRSDFKDQSDFDFKKSDQIKHLISVFGIRPPHSGRLSAERIDPATLYGWLLWAYTQPWVNNPLGWAIKVTLNPSRSLSADWHQLADWLLDLPDEDRAEMSQNGRLPMACEVKAAVWSACQQEITTSQAELMVQVIKAGHDAALWRLE